jgi:hypothetical protein
MYYIIFKPEEKTWRTQNKSKVSGDKTEMQRPNDIKK